MRNLPIQEEARVHLYKAQLATSTIQLMIERDYDFVQSLPYCLKFDHEIFIMIKVYAVRSVW